MDALNRECTYFSVAGAFAGSSGVKGNMGVSVEMTAQSQSAWAVRAEALGLRLLDAVKPIAVELRPVSANGVVADSTWKFLGIDRHGRCVAVVICSPSIAPNFIASNLERMKTAWCTLGAWSDVILAPFRSGTIDGLSYAVFPHCEPLSASRYVWVAQRAWIRPSVLTWLRGATATTASDATDQEREEEFLIPLNHLAGCESMPAEPRSAAQVAIKRLRDGLWQPKRCFMHGDLWKGNILMAPPGRGRRRFVLIDCGTCLVRGYGLYDLVRFASSAKLRGNRLAKEVRAHCQILGCGFVDARSHLLAALGHIGMNLGHFPFENYSAMSVDCLRQLSSIGG